MTKLETILEHERKERRIGNLGAVFLGVLTIFIVTAWALYL